MHPHRGRRLPSCLATARDLSNVIAYYRFDINDPLDTDADTDIEAVSDLSGNGNNLVSFLPNPGFQPQRDAVEFISTDGSALFSGGSSRFLATTQNPGGDAVAQFDGSTSFSISCWCRRATDNTIDVIAGRQSNTTNLNWFLQFVTLDRLEFRVGRADGASPGSSGTALAAQTLNTGLAGPWHHCVGVYDASVGMVTSVLNADFANTGPATDASIIGNMFTSVDVPLRIGQGRTDPFHGNIDEVVIYNKALTNCEIQALFDLGTGNGSLL